MVYTVAVKAHWITSVSLLVIVAAATACGSSIPNYDYAAESNPCDTEFVVGVSDRLQITVWQNRHVSTSLLVRPDGTITLPLVGDLQAAGKKPSQLKKEITDRLKTFIKEETAIVTVAVTEVNSYRFSVSGEVTNAGVFNRTHCVTVVDALALAGGFTRFASRDKIVIVRRDDQGQLRQIPISYDAIAKGGHQEMNLVLHAGDQIVVP